MRFEPRRAGCCPVVIGGYFVRTTEVWPVGLDSLQKHFEALREGEVLENVSLGNTHRASSACVSSNEKPGECIFEWGLEISVLSRYKTA